LSIRRNCRDRQIGQDVLRYHQAVIDYATLTLFLKEEPA
jgi:hypothetical protein